MRSGYWRERFLTSHDAESWLFEKTGVEIETCAKNMARKTLPRTHNSVIEKHLSDLRVLYEYST